MAFENRTPRELDLFWQLYLDPTIEIQLYLPDGDVDMLSSVSTTEFSHSKIWSLISSKDLQAFPITWLVHGTASIQLKIKEI